MEIVLCRNRTAVTQTSPMSQMTRPFLISGKQRSMQLCWGRNLTLLVALAPAALVVLAHGSVGVINRGEKLEGQSKLEQNVLQHTDLVHLPFLHFMLSASSIKLYPVGQS